MIKYLCYLLVSMTLIAQSLADEKEALEVFSKRCIECHGNSKAKGGFKLSTLNLEVSDSTKESWKAVYDVLLNDEMPPKKAEQPSYSEKKMMLSFVTQNLESFSLSSPDEKDPKPSDKKRDLNVIHFVMNESEVSQLDLVRVMGLVCIVLLILARVYSHYKSPQLSPLLKKVFSPTVIIALTLCLIVNEYYNLHRTRAEALKGLDDIKVEDFVHYASFTDYGYPPEPYREQREAKLSSIYYRGNDERSEKLFNRGYYRTATFKLDLVDSARQLVNYNSKLPFSKMFVRYRIERAENTPTFFFSNRRMSKMFLTRKCDKFLGRYEKVQDAVNITPVKEEWEFEALYPLRNFVINGDSLKGTIYVCEQMGMKAEKVIGSRIHYAIKFDLNVSQTKGLKLESDLWMGSIYRTRKLPVWAISSNEWFSSEKIEMIKEDQNIDDPKLLGISDYLEAEAE